MRNIDARRIKPASTPTSSAAPPTAEDALVAIAEWLDLPEGRRRDLCSGIRFLGRVTRRPLATIVLDPLSVQAALDATTPAACDVTDVTFRGYRSFIRYVMRRLELLADRGRAGRTDLSPDWSSLLDTLPDRFAAMRLIALARFASTRGISPAAADDSLLAAFVAHMREADIRCTAWERGRRAAQPGTAPWRPWRAGRRSA